LEGYDLDIQHACGTEVQTFYSATLTRVHCLGDQCEEVTTVNTKQNVANVMCGMDIRGIGYLFINRLTDFRFQKSGEFPTFQKTPAYSSNQQAVCK